MRNYDRRTSGVLIITERKAHVGLLGPILGHGHARPIGNLGKVSVAVVTVEIIGLSIVGHEKVNTAVVVKVCPHHRESKTVLWIIHPRLRRYIRKCAVT